MRKCFGIPPVPLPLKAINLCAFRSERRAARRLYQAAPTSPLRVIMNGNRLDIQASVDLEGLKKLQEMLSKYQGILEMMEPTTNDQAAN
jgi:hypothetical protein